MRAPTFLTDENYTPDLISTRRGVRFDGKRIQDTIHEIEKIIKIKRFRFLMIFNIYT